MPAHLQSPSSTHLLCCNTPVLKHTHLLFWKMLQVNMQNLKDRERWASGWLQKEEMMALQAQRQAAEAGGDGGAAEGSAAAAGGTACRGCGASGRVPCPLCSLAGKVVEL